MGDWHTDTADWLSVPDAIERILAAVRPLPAETVPLPDALGRTLAEPAVSPIDQPPWDNSAMDGFAVRGADVQGATREAPVRLTVVDDIPAGGFPARPIGPGEAARIMTGAPVPEGADSVIRVEHTSAWPGPERDGAPPRAAPAPVRPAPRPADRTAAARPAEPAADAAGGVGTTLLVFSDADAGRNIRRRGEDVRAGTRVLEPGCVLGPAEIGLLAATGHAVAPVRRRPRIAILSNGDELVDLDRFDEVLAGRRIVNSNAYALAAAVTWAGGEPVPLGIAADDPADLRARLAAGRDADAIVTTAGASVGQHDLVKDALAGLGYRLDFWRIRMRPGSPFSFGRLDGVPVFGLAGNPVSALVTFEILVRPAIRRMLGRRAVHAPTLRVRAAERIPGAGRLTHFPRARLERDADGRLAARLTGSQGSGVLSSVAAADALLVVPAGVEAVAPGEEIVAIPLHERDPAAPDLGFSPAAT
ncbi:MAG TPA: gephyrin-like molybdotransferase Glp [Longimicrobiales bacterium]